VFTALCAPHALAGECYVEHVDDATRLVLETFWRTGVLDGASAIAPAAQRAVPAAATAPSVGDAVAPGSVPSGCPGHLVVSVGDVDAARLELGAAMGSDFGEPVDVPVRRSDGGPSRGVRRVAVSRQGPPHVVLVEDSDESAAPRVRVAVPIAPLRLGVAATLTPGAAQGRDLEEVVADAPFDEILGVAVMSVDPVLDVALGDRLRRLAGAASGGRR
jgi:hypothetical protein